jgi:hypothetical protein
VLTHDPNRNVRVMAAVQMEPATPADLSEAHALVARLIAPPIASLEAMQAAHAHTGAAVYVHREKGRISAVAGELPLTHMGFEKLISGRFDALDPHPDDLARPGEAVVAFYCWGCAGDTRRGAAAGVRAVVHARHAIYADVPFFTRAGKPLGASEADGSKGGHAATRRFACIDYPGQPGLIFSPAAARTGRSVAA